MLLCVLLAACARAWVAPPRAPRARAVAPRMGFWDLSTGITLLFVAIFTPFEVAFFAPQLYSGPINFTLNRIVDTIFMVDIFVSFFLPYTTSHQLRFP